MRVLLTGMSGTGKSALIEALAGLGCPAIDMDWPGWSEYGPEGDWRWCEDRVEQLLAGESSGTVIVSGCAENQGRFYPCFDRIILLSAPTEVLMERLRTRTNNPYGNHPEERAEVLGYIKTVEPLLRRSASHEIRTDKPFVQVLAAVLRIAGLEVTSKSVGRGNVSSPS